MAWAILDVDGVLADVRHRRRFLESHPKNWDAFFAAAPEDGVLAEGLSRAQELANTHDIVYLTGRPERSRSDTETWLSQHGFPEGRIVMRSDSDRRPARLFKIGQVRRLSRRQVVAVVLDDDPAVIDALDAEGYAAELVTWMDESEPQQSWLFEAQERDGRT